MVAFLLHGCKNRAKVQNLLTKGVNESFEASVKKTPEQHLAKLLKQYTC
jgi:hypothetical protein